jgi:two-component sensor histidine kinase
MGRIRALLSTGDIVLTSERRVADLRGVVDAALDRFVVSHRTRLTISGPAVNLSEATAAGLALALHELATNATKYGALSGPTGSVSVAWSLTPSDGRDRLALEWVERHGPRVEPPVQEGFGSRLIRYAASREAEGTVSIDYQPEGLVCRIQFLVERRAVPRA